jgi:CheY-like chemotaxis protein
MRNALILEKDAVSSSSTSQLLSSLGYVTAPVRTPQQALNVASSIRFDIIVTCTSTGELKRAAPEAAIILIAEPHDATSDAQLSQLPGVSAVVKRPSVKVLGQVVEFGIGGCGLQPSHVLPAQERRSS